MPKAERGIHQPSRWTVAALWPEQLHRPTQFALDLFCLITALMLAYELRFDFEVPPERFRSMLVQLPLVVPLQIGALFATRTYALVWRYIGLAEVHVFATAAALAAAPLLLLRLALPQALQDWRVPLSVILMDTILAFGALLSLRVGRRMLYERGKRRDRSAPSPTHVRQRVLLMGAGHAGVMAARELKNRGTGLSAIGFVDDDPQKLGSVIQGLRVLGGANEIGALVKELGIDHVILTIADATRSEIRRIIEICDQVPIKVRVIPGLFEVLEGRVEINRIRDVEIEDLLGRQAVQLEEDSLDRLLRGKRVLVTGAGGSIGSELAAQAVRFGPAKLLLLERSEYALFKLQRTLGRRHPTLEPVTLLADVQDEQLTRRIFETHRPQVVLHAAAHKHVPMLEYHASEAVRNNILATSRLGRLAGESGIDAFVLVSTDKAVRPSSIMGASKRVGELVIQDLSRRFGGTRFVAVRFGNVLDSTGSVIPIFREQILQGGPVTVTHPSVTRYFMTPSEAAQLVLQAGAIGESGEILILDMGEPIRIADLAQDMIRLSGMKPFEDIDIIYTGLRPGEKLFEELELDGEAIARTRHPKIFVGRLTSFPSERVGFALRKLAELANQGEDHAIRVFLDELLPESHLTLRPPETAELGSEGRSS